MPLIYAGIDEAGYGPLLGPLCVGMVAVRVDAWREGDPAPDLWSLLSGAVCREARKAARKIAVDDSKKLKLANSSTTRHPLYHLERAVGAFVACRDRARRAFDGFPDGGHAIPPDDAALFVSVNAAHPIEPWYRSDPSHPFPRGSTREEMLILANTLDLAASRAGVSILDLTCEAIGEGIFNQIVQGAGTKAAVTESALVKHFWTIWDSYGALGAEEGSAVKIVCDRQGGRTDYTDLLARTFPGCQVQQTHITQTQSRYEVSCAAATDAQGRATLARRVNVLFMTESESAHLPVALASMTAKLVRELFMARFNRYWCARLPELKPTAGYTTDARRWLDDARSVIQEAEQRVMVRRA